MGESSASAAGGSPLAAGDPWLFKIGGASRSPTVGALSDNGEEEVLGTVDSSKSLLKFKAPTGKKFKKEEKEDSSFEKPVGGSSASAAGGSPLAAGDPWILFKLGTCTACGTRRILRKSTDLCALCDTPHGHATRQIHLRHESLRTPLAASVLAADAEAVAEAVVQLAVVTTAEAARAEIAAGDPEPRGSYSTTRGEVQYVPTEHPIPDSPEVKRWDPVSDGGSRAYKLRKG